MLHDLRYGIRTLAKNPWSTAVTIFSLALGIGVNVAVFTAYKAFLLRPLDAKNAEEMVNIALTRESGALEVNFSYPDYEAYRDSVRTFGGLVAYRPQRLQLSSAGERIDQRTAAEASGLGRLGIVPPGARNAEFAMTYIVSENFFQVFGVGPMRGRSFESLAAEPAVLISENYWQRRFSGDPTIIGRTVRLNQVAVTIAGVTPHDFAGPNIGAPAFWMPASLEPLINADSQSLRDRENRRYRLLGRLAQGNDMARAKEEFTLAANRLRALHDPQSDAAKASTALVWPGSPFPFPISTQRGLQVAIFLIMFAAGMVLAVASANAGGLQLARARVREAELRTRLSLGATRLRVIRQLLTESALVGVLAGAAALLFSWVMLKGAVKMFAQALPVEIGAAVFDVNPNLTVFAFVFLISLIGGVLSGLAPALHSPRQALSSSGRASTGSVRGRRLQNALVAVQVALSLVLMITGSMFVRGAVHALGVDPGYDSKHLAELNFQFPIGYTSARKNSLASELRSRMIALTGVDRITSAQPPGASVLQTAAMPVDEAGTFTQSILRYTYVQPGYFETLQIPLVAGASFERDTQNGRFVVLSESAAKQLFGGENPLGRRIRLGWVDERVHQRAELIADKEAYQVIGLVGDTRGLEFDGSDSKRIYLSLASDRVGSRPLLIRTQPNASALISQIESAASSVDPEMVVTASTAEDALRRSPPFIGSILAAGISSLIGGFGLLLALMGIFATVSHIVALRTREVGIRIAVGAQKGDVLRLILGESSRPVIPGLAAGMVLASGVVYLLRNILYGISPVDGIYFAGVSLLFFAVALLASYPPARRAMSVDPVTALRYE